MSEKPSKYYNFGSAWLKDSGISCAVDWKRNGKSNDGQAYKVFLVAVDSSGNPVDEGKELSFFKIRTRKYKGEQPPGAPDYEIFSWE